MEALEQAPDLEAFWKKKEAEYIAPYIKKSRQILLDYGIDEDRIKTKVANGTRSAANDILKEARKNDFGTIVMGRRGLTGLKDFIMGSVTTKVLQDSSGLAIWIVQ
jgi:nucleotide-binding universal stress UspA family protein